MFRKRNLDEISSNIDGWRRYNSLFQSHTADFDRYFDSSRYSSDVFVHRGDRYEEKLMRLFFRETCNRADHKSSAGKIYLLVGPVGSGKSTIVRYIGNSLLDIHYKRPLYLYVNCYKLFGKNQDVKSLLAHISKARLISKLIETSELYESARDIALGIFSSEGFNEQDLAPGDLARKIENIDFFDLLMFCLGNKLFDRVLLALDNIDECSSSQIDDGISFANELIERTRQEEFRSGETNKLLSKMCILVPCRRYTKKRLNVHNSTEHYFSKELKTVSEVEVLKRRIDLLSKDIDVTNKVIFSGHVSRTTQPAGSKGPVTSGRRVAVSHKWVSHLLRLAVSTLDRPLENEAISIIRSISNGNLKISVKNAYYLFHSCKLELSPILEIALSMEDSFEYKGGKRLLPKDFVIECLMCIHFPFYDVDSSWVTNIFNAFNSNSPGDFRNTLILHRIVSFVNTYESVSLSSLRSTLNHYGYGGEYFEKAMEKCFDRGLLSGEHGAKYSDLQNEDNIVPTDAGCFYIQELIFNRRYIAFVHDDVPMEDEYRSGIIEKHEGRDAGTVFERRKAGARSFVRFLREEEGRERAFLKARGEATFREFCDAVLRHTGNDVLSRNIGEALDTMAPW